MNGLIAQLVALTCHANAFLRSSDERLKFFPDNSTCTFCDRISFVEVRKPLIGRQREIVVADTPEEWFKYLARKKALGVRLIRESNNDPRISDRMTAGFVGGGGTWMLEVRYPDSTDLWMARWEVWDQNAPGRRIWRVTYGLVASRPGSVRRSQKPSELRESMRAALLRIHSFSKAHDCGPFTESFSHALESLADEQSNSGDHKDLFVEGTLSEPSRAVLDAAQSAWVFGGMGSWNDLGFEGDAGREYEEVSERLYSVLSEAICVAANETDTA